MSLISGGRHESSLSSQQLIRVAATTWVSLRAPVQSVIFPAAVAGRRKAKLQDADLGAAKKVRDVTEPTSCAASVRYRRGIDPTARLRRGLDLQPGELRDVLEHLSYAPHPRAWDG